MLQKPIEKANSEPDDETDHDIVINIALFGSGAA